MNVASKRYPVIRGLVAIACGALVVGAFWIFFFKGAEILVGSPGISEKAVEHKGRRAVGDKGVRASAAPVQRQVEEAREPRMDGTSTNSNSAVSTNGRTPAECEAATMRDLLDSGDEKGALKMARRLLDSPEAAVRSQVLSVLGWIGVRALPELTQLLADENEGIADEAFTQWKMAYDELQDDGMKAEMLVAAVGTMRKEEDMEALVMSVDQFPTDLAVRTLVKLVQGESVAASKVAREHYSFLTQTEYATPQAAEQWIRENGEPAESIP